MSAGTHRALLRRRPDALGRTLVEVAETPDPRCDPGDALLATVVAGICGTDWQILRGLRDDSSPVLGHEGVARLLEPGDTGLPAGCLVTVNPTHRDDPSFLLGHNLPGLWAERTRIPADAVRAGQVIAVPPGSDDPRVAALAEPLASVLYGLRIALRAIQPAALVVWGDGIVGRLARGLWQRELPGLPVVLVGHGDDAVDSGDDALATLLATLPAPAAAVVATPRTGTRAALSTLDRHVRGTLLIDMHAGLDPEPVPLSAGVIDVARLRAGNCGGAPWPPRVHHFDRPAGPLLIQGHRGVSGAHLLEAFNLLLTTDFAALGDELLTHEVNLAGAADLVNGALATPRRAAGGRRILKAAIRVGGHS